MKNLLAIILSILLTSVAVYPQNEDKKIKSIRDYYTGVSTEIEKIEKSKDAAIQSEIAVNEIVVNKLNKSWPAVGNYSIVYRFYYKAVGEEHYPNHLVKATKKTVASARTYYEEYLFSKKGEIMFVFEKSEDEKERRIYFENGKFLVFRGKADTAVTSDSTVVIESLRNAEAIAKLFSLSNQ